MEKFKNYLLGQADKTTAWIGVIGICLPLLGLQSVMFLLFIALIVLPQENFTDFFKKRTQQLRDLDKKQ
jgi:hypothetical protein